MLKYFLCCIIYCLFISSAFSSPTSDINLGGVMITDEGKKASIENNNSIITYVLDNNVQSNFYNTFSIFNNAPAIYFSSQSISDFDGYITLINKDKTLYSECAYFNLRTVNLIPMKRIDCNENILDTSQYQEALNELIEKAERNVSDYNTRLLLNKQVKIMPLLIYRDNQIILYQVLSGDLLGKPDVSTYVINSFGINKLEGNLYIYQTKDELFINEVDKNKKIISKIYNKSDLYKIKNNNTKNPLPSISEEKAFIYDDTFKLTKKYLIKGDYISLLDINQTNRMCKIKYITNKNRSSNYWIKCDTISHL